MAAMVGAFGGWMNVALTVMLDFLFNILYTVYLVRKKGHGKFESGPLLALAACICILFPIAHWLRFK